MKNSGKYFTKRKNSNIIYMCNEVGKSVSHAPFGSKEIQE